MLKTEKLESVGILAGGIAHDFNNILSVIIGNLSLAKNYVKTDTNLHYLLTEVVNASQRASNLTTQLLTFSKGGSPVKQTLSLEEIVKSCTKFCLRGSNVVPEYNIASDIYLVDADEGQLSQVFNNLAINASQAMPDGGCIKISGQNVEIPHDNIMKLQSGRYLKLVFEDNGPGIPESSLSKIFDTYFTTKHTGSGLGLATSYSIVHKST